MENRDKKEEKNKERKHRLRLREIEAINWFTITHYFKLNSQHSSKGYTPESIN